MAQNKLDKLVITLQTTLEVLVTKVNGLEQLIGDQNILIKRQGEKIQELLSLSTDTHNNARTSTEAETKPAARTARLRASAAITAGANSKSTNSTAKTLPRTPTDARSGALASAAIARTTRRTSVTESYACVATPPATAAVPPTKPTTHPCLDSEPPSEKNIIETVNEGNWKKVSRRPQKNNRRERAVIRGSGVFTCDLQTVERAKKIHACFFKPETSEETLKAFMEQKNPSNGYYEVKKMKLKHNHYSSFMITVPETKYDFFMSAGNWPAGTEVSEWFQRSAERAVRPLNRRVLHSPTDSTSASCTEASS